jgi:hypothetical protein
MMQSFCTNAVLNVVANVLDAHKLLELVTSRRRRERSEGVVLLGRRRGRVVLLEETWLRPGHL